jgi:RNA polymerase sigma-70 factor (ECF subfamily)
MISCRCYSALGVVKPRKETGLEKGIPGYLEDSDEVLMVRLREGNSYALEVLMDRYYRGIYTFIFQLVGDEGWAEDLTQDVFVQVYRYAPNYREFGKFKSWLYRIARNLSYNFLQRKRLEVQTMQDGLHMQNPQPDPSRPMQEEELHMLIKTSLRRVPEKYRLPLILCCLQGLSYEEAADVLRCSVKTLSSRLARGRERFKGLIKPYLKGWEVM